MGRRAGWHPSPVHLIWASASQQMELFLRMPTAAFRAQSAKHSWPHQQADHPIYKKKGKRQFPERACLKVILPDAEKCLVWRVLFGCWLQAREWQSRLDPTIILKNASEEDGPRDDTDKHFSKYIPWSTHSGKF